MGGEQASILYKYLRDAPLSPSRAVVGSKCGDHSSLESEEVAKHHLLVKHTDSSTPLLPAPCIEVCLFLLLFSLGIERLLTAGLVKFSSIKAIEWASVELNFKLSSSVSERKESPPPSRLSISIVYSFHLLLSCHFYLTTSRLPAIFPSVNQESILLTSCRSLVHCPPAYTGEKN